MNLPIDPAQISATDIGENQAVLTMDHAEAIEHVREICMDVGFGIPVEFSPADLLNEKVDANRDPYYVLGACNPALADRALDVTLKIGGLFPCNIIIWQEATHKQRVYHVSIMRIARLVGMAPANEEWDAIVKETSAMVTETFERLQENR